MKSLSFLALLLVPQATPRPAWDVAPIWLCETTTLRICTGLGSPCEFFTTPATFRIDFPAESFVDVPTNLDRQSEAATPAHDFSETIVARAWFAPSGTNPGFTRLSLYSADSVTLSGVPRSGGEIRDAIVTHPGSDSQYHWYGTCRPDAAKP